MTSNKLTSILILILIFFAARTNLADENSWADKITPEIALKAINIIETDLSEENIEGAASIIVNFADKSDDVFININEKYLPWITRKNNSKMTDMLLGAFVAGNIKHQLISGIPKDSPYEGVKCMINIYKSWRKAKIIEEIPELEVWSSYSNDQLRELIIK